MTSLVRNQRGQVLSGTLNPGGRPKLPAVVREMAQAASPRALAKVIEHLDHVDARVSLRAAEILLDRGYGRPVPEIVAGDQLPFTSVAEEHVRVLRDLASRSRRGHMETVECAQIIDSASTTVD